MANDKGRMTKVDIYLESRCLGDSVTIKKDSLKAVFFRIG